MAAEVGAEVTVSEIGSGGAAVRDGEDVRVACVGADEGSRAGGLSGDEVVLAHVVESSAWRY